MAKLLAAIPVRYRTFVVAAGLLFSHFFPAQWAALGGWFEQHGEVLLAAGGLIWTGWTGWNTSEEK